MRVEQGLLVERARRGDREAFAEIVAQHRRSVLSATYLALRDPHLAQDAAQETFVRAYEGLADLRDPQRLGAWLQGIARRVSWDWRRRASRRREKLTDPQRFDPGMMEANGEEGPDRRMEQRERQETLLSALDDLKESHRQVLVLRYLEDLSYREIAERLRTSVPIIEARLHRARDALRSRLRAGGIRRIQDA